MSRPVALVTGAGGGIGRATAAELSRHGYAVALAGRTESTLRQTAGEVADSLVLVGDVSDPEQARSLVQRVIERFGRLDALVNNAGYAPVRSVEEMTDQEWRRTIDTNLSAAFYLCRSAWPVFRRQNGGVVVNISSLSARDPFSGFAAYGAAKAGLNLLGLALAREGAAINVRVHTLGLGAVETPMFRTILSHEAFPTEKTMQPADVARVIWECIAGTLGYTAGEVIWLYKMT